MRPTDLNYYHPSSDENIELSETDLTWMIERQLEVALDAVLNGEQETVFIPFATPSQVEDYMQRKQGVEEEYGLDTNGWACDYSYTWSVFQDSKFVNYVLSGSLHYGKQKFYREK